MVQQELFRDDDGGRNSKSVASFLSNQQWIISLDKILLFVIAMVVLFVLTYSFGYERGRHGMEMKIESLTAQIETISSAPYGAADANATLNTAAVSAGKNNLVAANAETVNTANESAEPSDSVQEKTNQTESNAALPSGKYTIQVATILEKASAQKEIEKLETKGLKPFVLVRGRFYEVCVGGFESVALAKTILAQVRSEKVYADAFVRPIPQS